MDHIGDQKLTHDRRGWHLDKGVSITTIVALLGLCIPFFVWLQNLDKRVEMTQFTLTEYVASQEKQAQRDEQQRVRDYETIKELRREIRDLKK